MIFYSYFHVIGRDDLVSALDTGDPFSLDPETILERVLAAGYAPLVDSPRFASLNSSFDITYEVERDDQAFLVSIARDSEEIAVEEVRADIYETPTSGNL